MQSIDFQSESFNDYEVENSYLRRLHKILTLPVKELKKSDQSKDKNLETVFMTWYGKFKWAPWLEEFREKHGRILDYLMCYFKYGFKKKKKMGIQGFRSVLNRSLWMKNQRYRINLMELSMMCNETQLGDFLHDCEDFKIFLCSD